MRTARILALSRWAIGIAAALFVLAMLFYPGGTGYDASSRGYDFFRNFGSDLGRTVALDGRPNVASRVLSSLGGLLLMLGIVAGSCGVAAVYRASAPARRWALAAVVAGLLASSSVLAAFLVPADVDAGVHVRLASLGFDIAPVVPLCFALATRRDKRFSIGVASGWTLLTVVLGGFVGLRVPITSPTGLVVQVTAQKTVFVMIAAIFLYETGQAGRVVHVANNGSESSRAV